MLILSNAFTGCSTPERYAADAGAVQLTATMPSPIDVELHWRDAGKDTAGYVVEYTNDPKEGFVPLGFFPSTCHAYSHSRLIPNSKFHYRVRPFFGPASAPVQVVLPLDLSDEAYTNGYAQPEDYSWAPPAVLAETGSVAKYSLRHHATAAQAAPDHVKVELMSPLTVSGFKLTWTDHASDEDGFLLERRVGGDPAYDVCALVETNVNSFGWALEPPQRTGSFRIRAFYFGEPSNVVVKQTGKDPELGDSKGE